MVNILADAYSPIYDQGGDTPKTHSDIEQNTEMQHVTLTRNNSQF